MQKKILLLLLIGCALLAGSVSAPGRAAAPTATPADLWSLTVAAGPDGRLWAAWQADTDLGAAVYVARQIASGWSAPERLQGGRDDETWDRFPSLAVATVAPAGGPGGTPWLAWASTPRSDPGRRMLLVSRRDGKWAEPEAVPLGAALSAADPALAAGPDGTLWLAWSGYDGTDEDIFASRWAAGRWSEPWRVGDDDQAPALYDRHPRLAVGADGRPWVVWTGHQSGVDDEIYASYWTGSGWTREQRVSADDGTLDGRPSLALDAQGRPWVAWQATVAGGAQPRRRILAAAWRAEAGAWSAETAVALPADADAEEEAPALALDNEGRLHLAWLTTSAGASAVAHSTWTGERWTAAEVVQSGVAVDSWSVAVDGDGPAVLWLDAARGSGLPMRRAAAAGGEPLVEWLARVPDGGGWVEADSIPNRYLAFGDSITWGLYGEPDFYPYPSTLYDTLNSRVRPSDVINVGVPGEATAAGMNRIGSEVGTYLPRYVLLMEGTNDVSHRRDPAEVRENLDIMIDIARRTSKPMRLILGTLVPRTDDLNDETEEMNEQAIWGAAGDKNVPVCDQWQAFYNYGDWESIYWDEKHPDQTGLNLIASTFYGCILANYDEIYEDTTPPTATLDPVPPQAPCLGSVTLSWSGTDNSDGTGVGSYDVQVRVDAGVWSDWLVAYPDTSAAYASLAYGHRYYFRARARDRMGNLSPWTPEQWTDVTDTTPPYDVFVSPLSTVELHPFTVSWGGSDACSGVGSYNVRYRIDGGSTWLTWKTATPATSGVSDAAWACAHTYEFQAQACDRAGYCGGWSTTPALTVVACYGLRGGAYTVREQPVAAASYTVSPTPLLIERRPGGFLAYLLMPGSYDVGAARAGFGPLPAMQDVVVNDNVSGLAFYLPPADDAVDDGGFESGSLGAWDTAGTISPTLAVGGHTGAGALRLGAVGGVSAAGQVITPALSVVDPTLSLVLRLDQPGPASAVQVVLAGSGVVSGPLTYTLPVGDAAWEHAWLDLDGLAGAPLTVTLVVSGSPTVLVDEISLGSALTGGYRAHLPLVLRGQ